MAELFHFQTEPELRAHLGESEPLEFSRCSGIDPRPGWEASTWLVCAHGGEILGFASGDPGNKETGDGGH